MIKNIDLNKLAEEYGEGDNQLRDTLLNLWKNGIETFACCRGHDKENYYYTPYVAMYLNKNNIIFFEKLYESIISLDKDISIEFRYMPTKDFYTCSIYMRGEKNKVKGLDCINECLNEKNIKTKNDMFENIMFLLDYAKENDLIFTYYFGNNKMNIWYQNPLGDCSTSNNYVLSKELKKMKEKSIISFVPMDCDEESIKEFVNLLKTWKLDKTTFKYNRK